jgi:hypothetical protein
MKKSGAEYVGISSILCTGYDDGRVRVSVNPPDFKNDLERNQQYWILPCWAVSDFLFFHLQNLMV